MLIIQAVICEHLIYWVVKKYLRSLLNTQLYHSIKFFLKKPLSKLLYMNLGLMLQCVAVF